MIDATTRSFDALDLKRINRVYDARRQEWFAMSVLHNGLVDLENHQHDKALGERVQLRHFKTEHLLQRARAKDQSWHELRVQARCDQPYRRLFSTLR